jgi:hypothetical protein
MSEHPRSGRKDEQLRRDVFAEIVDETRQGRVEAHYANANRDQSRGDWNRSRKRGDEGNSRSDE